MKAIRSCGMPIATHSPNDKVLHSWKPESSNKPLQNNQTCNQWVLEPQHKTAHQALHVEEEEYDATTTLSLTENAAFCWIGGWVVPRASLGILQMRKISQPSWDSNPRWFSLYQLLQVSQDFLSTYECKPFMEKAQCALNNGTCAVFWKFICNTFSNSKLIRSTNSQTVSGPDFKGEIPSYT